MHNALKIILQAGVVLLSVAIAPILVLWAWWEAWQGYRAKTAPKPPLWHHAWERHHNNEVEAN